MNCNLFITDLNKYKNMLFCYNCCLLNVSKTGELFVKKIESILWSTFLIFNFNLSIKFFNSMISPLSNALTDAGLVIPNEAKPELKIFLFYLSLRSSHECSQ